MNKKKLLALLMALVMTLTLVPVTALATEVNVAEVGGTGYPTLQEAINAAQDGDTVKLLQSISVTAVIEISESIIIDGDGNTITSSANYGFDITSNVAVTLKNLTIGGTNLERAIQVESDLNNVSLTIENVTATATRYTVNIRGGVTSLTMNIENSTLTGWCAINLWGNGSNVTISDSHLTGNNTYDGATNDFGVVVLEASTGKTKVGSCASGNTITINGGSITATSLHGNDEHIVLFNAAATDTPPETDSEKADYLANGQHANHNTVYLNGVSVTAYNGGLVKFGVTDLNGTVTNNRDCQDNAVVISGGTYNANPTDYLADDYKAVNNNGTWTVSAKNYVAQVNEGTKYETLQAAIDAAQNGDTVKLLENIEIGAVSGATVSAFTVRGKDITIDGNNKIITANGDGKGYVFRFYEDSNNNPAQCVLKNLTINSTEYQVDILAGGSNPFNNTLSIDNVHVSTQGEAVYASDSAVITATNSSFAQIGKYNTGMQEPYYAAATVGYAGSLTLTDCEISAVSGSYAAAPFPSGGTITLNNTDVNGDLFAWIGNGSTTTLADSIININSGKVNGNYGYRVSNNGNGHIARINVNGGVYANFPANQEGVVIKEGYQVIANTGADSATYPYTVAQPVAEVNGTQYATLAEAFNAANASTDAVTINVLQSCTLDDTVTVQAGKNVTLNLNGKTVGSTMNGATYDDVMIAIEAGATMTVTGDGTITNYVGGTTNSKGLIHNEGTLTVNGGTFNDYGQGCGYALKNSGTMTVKAGTRIESFGTDSGNAAIYNVTGNLTVEDDVTIINHATDGVIDEARYGKNGYGVYAIRIDGGITTIGTVNAVTPTTVDGNRGAIGVNSGTLVINSGVFTGHIYRAMWITNDYLGTSVTINGGTFVHGSNSVYASVDDRNQDRCDVAVTVNDGYFAGSFKRGTKDTNNEWTFALKGGYYTIQPSANLIADGYEAVAINKTVGDITYNWQVGKIVNIEVGDPVIVDESYEQYSQTKSIVDENTGTAISETNNITVNVKPTTSESASIAPAALNNITDAAKAALVKAAVAEAPNNVVNAIVDVTIQVAKSDRTVVTGKVSYEVHPEAVITVAGSGESSTVALSNEQLDGTFSFTLEVTGAGFSEGDQVFVTNTHADGTSDVYGPFTVTMSDSKQIVEVTGVTEFSEVVVTPVSSYYANFEGVSLRRRVKVVDGQKTNEVVRSSTDVRFTYTFQLPAGATIDTGHSKLSWGTGGVLSKDVALAHYTYDAKTGVYSASLVLTGVKYASFTKPISTGITVAYTLPNDSTVYTFTSKEDEGTKSVNDAITGLIAKEGIADMWKDYAKFLNNKYTFYTILDAGYERG